MFFVFCFFERHVNILSDEVSHKHLIQLTVGTFYAQTNHHH